MKQAATDAVNSAKSTFSSVAGTAWKVGKTAATISGAFAIVAVASGAGPIGPAAYAGLSMAGAEQTMDWGISGLQYVAEGLSGLTNG